MRVSFCRLCGGETRQEIPAHDNRERDVCSRCGEIHYNNPVTVVGTLPIIKDRVLLCRRAIEPRAGFWTLPCGFLESGETVEEGAIRETLEEAGCEVDVERLFSLFSLPHIDQVYLLFLARMKNEEFLAGEESLEVRLFSMEEIPWSQIAFRAIEFALEKYIEGDLSQVHEGVYRRREGDPWIHYDWKRGQV